MHTADPAIRVRGLTKSYGQVKVLRGIDLDVRRGTVFALLGPNGAGKTTLVRILSTLVHPEAGQAVVAGHDVVRAPHQVRAAISLTGQNAAVDELLTGVENLRMIGRLRRLGRAESRRRASELLARFDLAEAARRPVKTYSGGMRRRLDLAMSLVTRPPVIFLDEPTTGLDPRSRQDMWDLIKDLADAGTTVFLTTQYLEEADRLAHHIVMINGGRVVAQGTAAQLKSTLAGEHVELTFADPVALSAAAAHLGAEATRPDPGAPVLRVPTDGSAAQVRRMLDRLAAVGVEADAIAVKKPTLDDVFLSLTARPAPATEVNA
ncbi:ATP-binding cassette domain-containing protein [Catellatospora sichuanensis]|uniref:ATP-binding cassette domain-containing protein n=1 Tax=Catellatospora sichuanensis TaxID=1969805 RepID=UPI0011840043|nr:ATP-binding cassette domain-containing protein [Catellatospora sichuanensis]